MFIFFGTLLIAFVAFIFVAAIMTQSINQKAVKLSVVAAIIAILALSINTKSKFNPSNAFISRDPAGSVNTVHFALESGRKPYYCFYAHDLKVKSNAPISVDDLSIDNLYYPGHLIWSRDGTLAVASVIIQKTNTEILKSAYDFKSHTSIHTVIPDKIHEGFDQSLRDLLKARGGSVDPILLPGFKELL